MRLSLLLLALFCPVLAHADRGALSLELGGSVGALRLAPPVGMGTAVVGTAAGAEGRVRYAFSNSLEVSLGGSWTAPAGFYQDGVTIVAASGTPFTGQLQSTVSRWSVTAGARLVKGTVFRFIVGGEVGIARSSFSGLDLIDTSPGGGGVSYLLNLGSTTATQPLIVGLVGLEWAVTDHLSFLVTPRLELLVGSPAAIAGVIPLSVSYSWYGLLR